MMTERIRFNNILIYIYFLLHNSLYEYFEFKHIKININIL